MVKMLNRPVTYGFADFVHFHVRLHEKLLSLRRFRQKWLFFYFTGILHKGKGGLFSAFGRGEAILYGKTPMLRCENAFLYFR